MHFALKTYFEIQRKEGLGELASDDLYSISCCIRPRLGGAKWERATRIKAVVA